MQGIGAVLCKNQGEYLCQFCNAAVGGLRRKSNRCLVHYMYVSKES